MNAAPNSGKDNSLTASQLNKLKTLARKLQAKPGLVAYHQACVAIDEYITELKCSVEQISEQLEKSKRSIYDWRAISKAFELKNLAKLEQLKNSKGDRLDATDLRSLAGLNTSQRKTVLAEWEKQALTTRGIHELCKSLRDSEKRKQGRLPDKRAFGDQDVKRLLNKLDSLERTLIRLGTSDLTSLVVLRPSDVKQVIRRLRELQSKLSSCETLVSNCLSKS